MDRVGPGRRWTACWSTTFLAGLAGGALQAAVDRSVAPIELGSVALAAAIAGLAAALDATRVRSALRAVTLVSVAWITPVMLAHTPTFNMLGSSSRALGVGLGWTDTDMVGAGWAPLVALALAFGLLKVSRPR